MGDLMLMKKLTSIEICAGAGGQALGLEQAGFNHLALVEIDKMACATLRRNRPLLNVIECDVRGFSAFDYKGVDLLAAGIPCPPFSCAGKQLGELDERDLFPEMIRLANECRPKAVLIENVKGLLDDKFINYRNHIKKQFLSLGYYGDWKLFNACDFGVPQLRPRAIFVAFAEPLEDIFTWPVGTSTKITVGEALYSEMKSNGWKHANIWKQNANTIAPTLVGGSKKHGGPDLGPTRSRLAWKQLGVDGGGIADCPPLKDYEGMPRLTVKMAAVIQGFPPEWIFVGKKTPAYRQVGNAFPPPVAYAIGKTIADALEYKGNTHEEKIGWLKSKTQGVLLSKCG